MQIYLNQLLLDNNVSIKLTKPLVLFKLFSKYIILDLKINVGHYFFKHR